MNRGSRFDERMIRQGGEFRQLIGHTDGSGTPDIGVRNVIRSSVTSSPVQWGSRRAHNARLARNLALDPRLSSVLTLASNNFATGTAIIRVGDYELVSGVDYAVDAVLATTVANIGTALANLPEVQTVVASPDIQVLWAHPGRLRFEVAHRGTVTNFTLAGVGADPTNETGLMNYLGITLDPPTVA